MAREAPYLHHTVKYTLEGKKKKNQTICGDHFQKTFTIISPTFSIMRDAMHLLVQDLRML